MPLYEYKCSKCEYIIEKLQKINSVYKEKCCKCNLFMDRIISRTHFKLKGKGWYETDLKNKTSSDNQ